MRFVFIIWVTSLNREEVAPVVHEEEVVFLGVEHLVVGADRAVGFSGENVVLQ